MNINQDTATIPLARSGIGPKTCPARAAAASGMRVRPDPDDIRQRLLAAGTRCFADRGYADTSVRTIVASAHANEASINYHFRSKWDFYVAVLRNAFGLERARQALIETARRDGEIADVAVAVLDALGQALPRAGNRHLALRLLGWELVLPTGALQLLWDNDLRPLLDGIAQRLDAAGMAGDRRIALWLAAHGAFLGPAMARMKAPSGVTASASTFALFGLLGAPGPTSYRPSDDPQAHVLGGVETSLY